MDYKTQILNKSAYLAAQSTYLQQIAAHCDYGITLQTRVYTCGANMQAMQYKLEAVEKGLYVFRHKLNRLLTGNGSVRKNNYLPVFVAAIEGTMNNYDLNRTLHIHAALGNTGHRANEDTRELLEDGIRQIWEAIDIGTDDVKVDLLTIGTEARWIEYICKEASKGNIEVINYKNTQAPSYILNKITG
jgi:hypothetical protein